MGRWSTTNVTPKRNDSELTDRQFWTRFERICLRLHEVYPDLEFVRTRGTWEMRSQDKTAMEAFEELSLIFCKRMKVPQVRTPGDAVQAFIWTIFSNRQVGDNYALKAIDAAKKDFGAMFKGRLTEV